jgi:hypothetical protein
MVKPSELTDIRLALPYYNRLGVRQTLTLTFALQEPITNAAPRETEEQIRRRAPQVFATQNRMVSGEDYNSFPLSSNLATKIKAVTRTYSGQSRFVDLNDPTGNYRDVTVFGDDGAFYKEGNAQYAEVPISDNRTADEIVDLFVQPMLKSDSTVNYVLDYFVQLTRAGQIKIPDGIRWTQASSALYSSTGAFNLTANILKAGATILFSEPQALSRLKWVTIANLSSTTILSVQPGLPGPVTLAEPVVSGSRITAIVPRYASSLPDAMLAAVSARLGSRISFSLWFDWDVTDPATHWSIRPASAIGSKPVSGTAIQVLNAEYLSGLLWRFTAPGMRYVFESERAVQFYFGGQKGIDSTNGQVAPDLIRVLKLNDDLLGGATLERDYNLNIDTMIRYADGFEDPTRVSIVPSDRDEDGYPDDPDFFYRVISNDRRQATLFWTLGSHGLYTMNKTVWVYMREADRVRALDVPVGTLAFQIDGTAPNSFWLMTANGWQVEEARLHRWAIGRGSNIAARWYVAGGTLADAVSPAPIKYMWKHYAPGDRRIDPSKTNIIDVFVLASEYDFQFRSWIASGAIAKDEPAPPSELDLRISFGGLEDYKMFSDDLVWRPAQYKCLFGSGAASDLRAKFKVVKLPNTNLSDGEIRAKVIQAISRYFSAEFWDFGETFYYTELAAYVHQQLANVIGSIVIVPEAATGVFGDGFEVRCRLDEIFISTATVNDVTLIDSNTPTNLRFS